MKRLIRVWLMMAGRAAESQLLTTWAGALFLIGKLVRFLLFFVFLFVVASASKTIAGYSQEQVIVFYLVFNIVDITIQFLFRGVYQFRFLVVSGDYDLDLLRPLPSFFRPIFGWTDILDLITLLPLCGYFFWFIFNHRLAVGLWDLLLFLILMANSLVIGFSLHLLICSVCILTTKVDHLVWIYRDLTGMARFPTDIYQKGVQWFLTFVFPVIVMIAFPVKALIGHLDFLYFFLAFIMSLTMLWLSLQFWRFSLKRYTGASS